MGPHPQHGPLCRRRGAERRHRLRAPRAPRTAHRQQAAPPAPAAVGGWADGWVTPGAARQQAKPGQLTVSCRLPADSSAAQCPATS
eukprot:scaffold676_cov115-Isochrysis_galbana.AAC.4